MSPTGWVGTCRHPVDGKDYIIAYRDCCGKEYCGRCACHGDKGDLPIYRTQLDNEVLWCFGVKSGWAVNCTTAVNLESSHSDRSCATHLCSLPNSNIRNGPRECAGRFPFWIRMPLNRSVAFDGRGAAQDDSSKSPGIR